MADNHSRPAPIRPDHSRLTKERICLLLQESINESGKVARNVTHRSNSREVRIKCCELFGKVMLTSNFHSDTLKSS